MAQSQLDKPQEWATGADAPTQKQTSFLQTLSKEKGVEIDVNHFNKGDASAKINELKYMGTKNPSAPQEAAGKSEGEPIQDPSTWSTGDGPATSKQTGYIAVMAKEAGEKGPGEGMGKSEASRRIEELKGKTGM